MSAELGAEDLPDTAFANLWLLYEERKRAWSDQNPHASSAEYEAAIQRICDEIWRSSKNLGFLSLHVE